ncbi:Isovaleryl-CoA dehydrogenase [Labilithrix luteola]|uniref:Cyclohexane-1-carbonyl-CoA dehydrogenase n=1 Tax=Labilithrix luteola TaxID=1391654 RepID=A0A0K1PUM0_9BACT|nr:acyl-CoA dehydrogenase family protein [Labilithrix luteola]AKU97212.1 Isovaleryl-CoA dehydrogenase [Labilithrix luteola]
MPSPFREEHEHFRNTVRQFAQKEIAPFADEWEEKELFPNELFKRAGELGLFGAHYPEEHGGAGGDYWFSIAKAEELPKGMSAGVSMGLLVQGDMATPCISDLGSKEQIEEFLKPALRGDKIAALGVSEPNAGSDVAGIQTWAKQDGSDWIINGAKTYITNGTRADFVTLLVKTNPEAGAHGCSFFLVPTSTKGFSVSKKLKKIGNHASDTAELAFEDMRVPARFMLGEPNQGFMYLMQNFQTERLIACASAVSGMQEALNQAIEYGRDRKAFGKPIIKREYWQHKFVDLQAKIEAGRALTYKAAEAYNEEKHVKKEPLTFETVKLISMAKIFVGEIGSEVIDQCLQFHGGAGYVEEYPIARAWRDQRLLRIGGGTTETMRYYVAKLMGL